MAGYETILSEVKDGIARVTLNRPERLNGMTNRMVVETHDAVVRAAGDPDVRVLVLTEFLDQETQAHMRIGQSADTQEAFRAFVEKREPNFARS